MGVESDRERKIWSKEQKQLPSDHYEGGIDGKKDFSDISCVTHTHTNTHTLHFGSFMKDQVKYGNFFLDILVFPSWNCPQKWGNGGGGECLIIFRFHHRKT